MQSSSSGSMIALILTVLVELSGADVQNLGCFFTIARYDLVAPL
jgi:hypothetical protein